MGKKILLIRLSSLGDVIHTIPLANSLKAAGHEITWLVSEKGIQVLEGNPCLDRVILAPVQLWKKRGPSLKSFKEYLSILKQLRAEKFDIAIDAQMMLKSLYWMAFCGAKRKIISKQARELSVLGANEVIPRITENLDSPVIRNYMKYADYLGVDTEKITVTLPERSNEVKQKADGLLKDIKKPLVVIAPATTWAPKHWNKDHWKKVVQNLKDKCSIVFTGGPKDDELIKYIGGDEFLNLAGKTNVIELAEIFSRADVVLAPDSGSAHLAWATQKPAVVTIFTCTPLKYLAPPGDENKYIAVTGNLPCQPCFKRKCRFKTNACTNLPSPEEIINIVNKLLSNRINRV